MQKLPRDVMNERINEQLTFVESPPRQSGLFHSLARDLPATPVVSLKPWVQVTRLVRR